MRGFLIVTFITLLSAVLPSLTFGNPQEEGQEKSSALVVPSEMPYSEPFGPPISLEDAELAAQAARAEAIKRHWAMDISVVDSGGNLVLFKRMTGAQLGGIEIAQDKARTAVYFRRDTQVFENSIHEKGNVQLLSMKGITATRGGLVLRKGHSIIGAIGCSSGTPEQDETVCRAGSSALSK